MNLPVTGSGALVLAVLFGSLFGALLQRGRVTDYNVIVNQFRLKDFTVVKVMLTAVLVGGLGVWLLHSFGFAEYHIKAADLLAVALGAAIFGVGMVLYGYCPGTGVAAIGEGSIHALVGFLGMLVGGVVYALNFDWIREHITPVASLGKVRLPDLTGIPDLAWLAMIGVIALAAFTAIERYENRSKGAGSV